MIFLPTFVNALFGLIEKPHDMGWNQHLLSGLPSLRAMFGHAILQTAFLPYEAWFNMDAIVRTCWRMAVSRRRLLEWRPSSLAAVQHQHGSELAPHVVRARCWPWAPPSCCPS